MASGGSKTQTTTSSPWAGALPGMNTAMSAAMNPAAFNPFDTKSLVAGFNNDQATGMQGVRRDAGRASQLANMGTSAMQGMLSSGPNPYLGDLYNMGSRNIANDVNAQFSKAGRYGSGAQTDVLTSRLGDMWSQMAGNAYENDQNRKLQATSQLGSLYELGQQGNRDLLGVGAMQQGQEQSVLDAPRNNIEWLANIASGLGSTGSSQTGRNPNYRSATDNLIGLGSTLGSAWLLSDRRLKTDVERLGEDEFGLPWYEYRYIWDAPEVRRVGVMADEAPAHAVRKEAHHFAMVDYAKLAEPLHAQHV